MVQIFNDEVEITGAGNQVLELACTANPQSRTRILAVNSNQVLEGQIQFVGAFGITAIPGSPSSLDGNGPALTYYDSGFLQLLSSHQVLAVHVDTRNGGVLQLFHPNGSSHIELIANETAPENNGGGLVLVHNGDGTTTIRLNGHAGTVEANDILLSQADCAEDFDLVGGQSVEPGSVMAIDDAGALKESESAYDRKVAGVISGAGDYKPGITLDREPKIRAGRQPIALSGKVFCKVDASYHPIEVGDLLVSSPTKAHAMKAKDPMRSFGATIGKALRGLPSGRGLIPILVALQ
jgi:hypothetical protein